MSYSLRVTGPKPPFLRRWPLCLLVCLIATIGPGTAFAKEPRLALREIQVVQDEGVYELDARLDITLPQDARKAVDAGLTLRLSYEIVVDRVRRYMLDAEVASLVQRYEVTYHALSQRYLVKNLNTGEQYDFGSLEGALDRVGDLRGLPILDAALAVEGPVYEGRVRAVLDMNSTPDALGWLLFWADDWSSASDWKVWTLRP